jgi:hypothetical protein
MGTYYSLSKFQTVSFTDKESLANIFVDRLHLIYERYTQFPIDSLFLRYTVLHADSILNKTELNSGLRDLSHLESLSEINLPSTLELSKWGNVSVVNPKLTLVKNKAQIITVLTEDNIRTISILRIEDNKTVISFTDTITSLEDDQFIRTLDNGKTIHYSKGSQDCVVLPSKKGVFIEKINKADDCIDLGDKMLVAYSDTKNIIVERPMSEQEAIQLMAKELFMEVEEMEDAIEWDKDKKRLFKKLTKGGNFLNISLPIAAAFTSYARCNIYEYKDYVA